MYVRIAAVISKSSSLGTVQHYLPSNYNAAEIDGQIFITGQDRSGWTLDDYVIPRLASGLHSVVEVDYQQTELEHEVLFNSGATPELGRDYFLDADGDVLVPVDK